MKNAITNYENIFYLDGAPLSGVLSVNGSYNLDYKPINVVGKGFVKQIMSSVPKADLSISRNLITNDPVFRFTGDGRQYKAKPVNGGLYYLGKYFGFENAYLNSISLNCAIGEAPTIESSFEVYGKMGSGYNPSGNKNLGNIFVSQVKDITLRCRNYCSNRITNFDINFNTPKNPIYGLSSEGSHLPIEVHNTFPVEVTANFVLEIDDYEVKDSFADLFATNSGYNSFFVGVSGTILEDMPLNTSSGNYDLLTVSSGAYPETLYSYLKNVDHINLFNFSSSKATIVSEEISSDSDGVSSVKLSYKTFID